MQTFSVDKSQLGATLIEVLVSVAVTSIGLLGMAGMMAVSTRLNYGAYQRTQTSLIAQALIDSMHVNAAAVAQGRYDGSFAGNSKSSQDCRAHACNALQRADFDRTQFDRSLGSTLPNVQAGLRCTGESALAADAAVYNGTCRLEIDWSERALTQASATSQQSLVWVFEP